MVNFLTQTVNSQVQDVKWMQNMVYSAFVLGIVIFALFLFTVVTNNLKIKQLKKFKDQKVNVYESKSSKWTLFFLELTVSLLSLLLVILFIVQVSIHGTIQQTVDANNNHIAGLNVNSSIKGRVAIAVDSMFLAQVVFAVIYLFFSSLWNSSIIIVSKNNTLVTVNDYIDKSDIKIIRTDDRRWFYYITYKDKAVKHNLMKVRIRYSYKLKDFLIKEGYLKSERKKNG